MASSGGQAEGAEERRHFQHEESWMTIEQEGTIVHLFMLGQFLHNAATRCIIQDGRSRKLHLGKLGPLESWEQCADHSREYSGSEFHVDYLGFLGTHFEASPLQLSDSPLHISEVRFRVAADRRVIKIPDVQFRLYSTGDLIYRKCEQERADRREIVESSQNSTDDCCFRFFPL